VVEHMEDDLTFLKTIYQKLEKNGRFYITVPAYSVLWSNVDKESGHYRRYTLNSMCKQLKACGFEIEYSTYIFSILPLPVFIFRTLPSLFGFSKKRAQAEKKKEHAVRKNSLLDQLWQWEIKRISEGKKIWMGGSCLILAKK
jgi:hypothetical protein